MLVLGIETTCDETGFSLVRSGREILSNVVASQAALHARHGGVIPELASRQHIEACTPLLKEALQQAHVSPQDIDLIAVARGPGLIGAILVGMNFAKGLAMGWNKPWIGVNHVEAHLYAVWMNHQIPLPALGVVISGGHTALVVIRDLGNYQVIGQTQDDAIGEAFDKAATLLGLSYPGGPEIEKLAKQGHPSRFSFKAWDSPKFPFDFSFSGLKTAVLYQVKGQNANRHSPLIITEEEKAQVAASFQEAALGDIVNKSLRAAAQFNCKSLIIGGGVSQNQRLRSLYEEKSSLPVFWPSKGLCLDNAAMIAGLGYINYQKQGCSDPWDLDALPRLPL